MAELSRVGSKQSITERGSQFAINVAFLTEEASAGRCSVGRAAFNRPSRPIKYTTYSPIFFRRKSFASATSWSIQVLLVRTGVIFFQ